MRRTLAFTAVILIALLMCAFLFSPLLAGFDARRVAAHKPPAFCWSRWVASIPLSATRSLESALADGGTSFHEGFGYHFTRKHKIAALDYAPGEKAQFDSGVVVRFYLPWYNRFDFETTFRDIH